MTVLFLCLLVSLFFYINKLNTHYYLSISKGTSEAEREKLRKSHQIKAMIFGFLGFLVFISFSVLIFLIVGND